MTKLLFCLLIALSILGVINAQPRRRENVETSAEAPPVPVVSCTYTREGLGCLWYPGYACCNTKTAGALCYNAEKYQCMGDQLCPIDKTSLCRDICYDSSANDCSTDGVIIPRPNPDAIPEELIVDETSMPENIVTGVECSDRTCPHTDHCCNHQFIGSVCFNPLTHVCAGTDEKSLLCPLNEPLACGAACYHPDGFYCQGENLYALAPGAAPVDSLPTEAPVVETPPEPSPCDWTQCVDGNQCCSDNTIGPVCFDPITHTCANGALGHVLCDIEHPSVCGHACYHSAEYECVGDTLVSSSNYFAEGAAVTAQGARCDNIVCPGSDSCCDLPQGPRCFDSQSHRCLPGDQGNALCGIATSAVCGPDNQCYDPNHYSCINGQLSVKTEAAVVAERVCTYQSCGLTKNGLEEGCCMVEDLGDLEVCFDPQTHACVQGRFLCGMDAPDVCGSKCYHSAYYICENSNLIPK